MNIINMYEDFKTFYEDTKYIGKWEAWKRYHEKYRGIFDLYLGVGLGHVNGTAFILDRPFVYFGLETLYLYDLNILVPHEFNHMVRFFHTNMNNGRDTLKDRVMAEGLGTFSSLLFLKGSGRDEDMAKAMMVSEGCLKRLKKEENHIKEEIFHDMDLEMNEKLMTKYFTYNYKEDIDGMPVKTGYYIGLLMVQKLHGSGYSLPELTKMETDEIIEEWNYIL